jgi:hypothetical protein
MIPCIVALAVGETAMAQVPVYPGSTWAEKTPAEVGMDAGKLDALRDHVGGRGCVVRYGHLVYTWGDPAQRGDVASAAKPWYSHFLLKAVEEGKIASLDDPAAAVEPRLNSINADLGFKDRKIAWRHLANQTSCYGVTEAPGSAFDYNDWQMALFWDCLFLKVYGATYDDVDETVVHPLLTDILQCEDNPTFMAFGTGDRPGRVGVSVRDFARFGLLYLRKGNWRGRQLISEEHAAMAVGSPLAGAFPRTEGREAGMISGQRTMGSRNIPDNQCDHLGSYSWLWWTNGVDREGQRHWPDAPEDAYGAFGHGGPRAMVVIPSLDVIVSWNDAQIKSREMENEALRLLSEAVVQRDPRHGQIIVDPEHPQWLRRKGIGPLFMCGPGDPEDFLYRGKRNADGTRDGDQMALIEKLKGTGANCIYLMALRSHGGDGDRTHNPFVDNDPDKGINHVVLDQWDEWFTAMDEAGIAVFLFIYDDSARVWDTGDEVGEAEARFVRALVNRFEHHLNLIWCIAEEYAERLSPQRVRNLAALVREADDHDHPIAVHKNHGLDFAELADDPNINQFAMQYNVPTAAELHRGVVEAWKGARGRYNLNLAEAADWGTGAEARKKAWACAMGGAYVMVLGMDIASTPVGDLEDCGRVVRFVESVDLQDMAPHKELAFGGTEFVLADPPQSYIAYASDATGKLGLKRMAKGSYDLRWLDCATGREAVEQDVALRGGDEVWPIPGGLGPEVAVYATRAGGREP